MGTNGRNGKNGWNERKKRFDFQRELHFIFYHHRILCSHWIRSLTSEFKPINGSFWTEIGAAVIKPHTRSNILILIDKWNKVAWYIQHNAGIKQKEANFQSSTCQLTHMYNRSHTSRCVRINLFKNKQRQSDSHKHTHFKLKHSSVFSRNHTDTLQYLFCSKSVVWFMWIHWHRQSDRFFLFSHSIALHSWTFKCYYTHQYSSKPLIEQLNLRPIWTNVKKHSFKNLLLFFLSRTFNCAVPTIFVGIKLQHTNRKTSLTPEIEIILFTFGKNHCSNRKIDSKFVICLRGHWIIKWFIIIIVIITAWIYYNY